MDTTLKFGTKAETLLRLSTRLTTAIIPDLAFWSVSEWQENSEALLDKIQIQFSDTLLAIRSSAQGEDGVESSHAGEFESILNVSSKDRAQLKNVIESVVASYPDKLKTHQFLVQEQITDIAVSGVAFTRDIDTLAPYYVINYDAKSGSTSSVTSGTQAELQTYIRSRHSLTKCEDSKLAKLIVVIGELEEIFGNDALDIEFAVDYQGKVYLLQVRPIVKTGKVLAPTDQTFERNLFKIYRKLEKLNGPHPGIHGKRAIYSVMTDWNPAEMIGIKPRPLSLSLYKELITDSIWAYQRNNYGYRDLRSFPLLVSLLGFPYVDVRTSFNSFIPREVDETLAGKLVDYYISTLAAAPTDHDKVEFNIVYSCYYLNLPHRIKGLLNHGFTELEIDRIKFALLSLTNQIISPTRGLYRSDLQKVDQLKARFDNVMASDLFVTDKIYWLIEDCKRYGTLPFAGLARAGFIAMQLLRSMIESEIISEQDFQNFMNSLNTVARRLSDDTERYVRKELTREEMIQRYGHLRPGSYDLLSPRYDEAFDLYFGTASKREPTTHKPFSLTPDQTKRIGEQLLGHGLHVTVEQFMVFIAEAIEGREYGKFVFTRNLSQILTLIEQMGTRYGFSKEEMTYLDIRTIIDLYSSLSCDDMPEILGESISRNRRLFALSDGIRLPQLITDQADVYDFYMSKVEPNFITRQRVTNTIVLEEDFPAVPLNGSIVFIRSADPGYDWIFSRNIAGLVTMYGGANSHMAIRCAELKIPAIIGCGEQNYGEWSRAQILDIDCANRKVKVVN